MEATALALSTVAANHNQVSQHLSPHDDRVPTRSLHLAALELAEEALELARDTDYPLPDLVVRRCETFRDLAYQALQGACSGTAEAERATYDQQKQSPPLPAPNAKRMGVLFEVDKGEHLVEALQAVCMANELGDGDEEEEGEETVRADAEVGKKVRWAGELEVEILGGGRSPVRMRDVNGMLLDSEKDVPELWKQPGQSFEEWKCVI